MIESTNLKMLRNLEAFQVFSDILAFLQEEESVEEPLQGLCDAFAARLSDYDTALVSERRSRYTAELARLDGQRDYVFRSFTAQLKGIPFLSYITDTLFSSNPSPITGGNTG